jgi:Domain of unknown function (DUF4192)
MNLDGHLPEWIEETEPSQSVSPSLVIRSPRDLVAAIPYLIGFHPVDSLVVVGSGGPNGTCAARVDLTPAGAASRSTADDIGRCFAGMLKRNGFPIALLVGYGPGERVTPMIDAARQALAEHGVQLREALRVEGNHFWSYLCVDPECCPAEGAPFDTATSAIAAQATLGGQVALASREELAQTVASLTGVAREAMRQATGRAEERICVWVEEDSRPTVIRTRMAEDGLPFVREASARVNAGGTTLSDDEIAWLGVLLTSLRVRDEALVRIDPDRLQVHIEFWRDVLRRVEQRYAAAPACLLSYAAYSCGDGALANVALDRAFSSDPSYSLATLLHDLIAAALPPSKLRLGITADELAKAYDEQG